MSQLENMTFDRKITRRDLIKVFGAAAVAGTGIFGASNKAYAKSAPHVVVLGGGVGGSTFSKYLRFADPDVKITIIEQYPEYITCLRSNDVIVGMHTLDDLTFNLNTIKSKYNVNVVIDKVVGADFDKKTVRTEKGHSFQYDKLVVSPGIDFKFEDYEGYNAELAAGDFPHAYKAGPQTLKLRDQLFGMRKGGVAIIAPPQNPFRCPPGPYERASFFAEHFKNFNPTAKLIVLDPKERFTKDVPFKKAWERLYGYKTDNALLEWIPGSDGGKVVGLDAKNKTVLTEFGEYKADVINIIPNQRAGKLAQKLGLTDRSGWCPIDRNSFESTIHKEVYVLGDSSIADAMPKSGYSANSQAKVCAQAVADTLKGNQLQKAIYSNVCYSLAGQNYGVSIAAIYEVRDGLIQPKGKSAGVSPITDKPAQPILEAVYQKNWQREFVKDVFS
ncbi:NAD(P)/FAD-dependent oxidoreductase [Hydrogenovibrio thermophilus]|uniref:Flavocytochrome c sulfide dehydrogenase flavin-binding protein n=1 Tax=Hydrogenovibrio thermophilus TaxID=265883 RepID=A0A410H4K7_9GAMM|nr:NAD(P)/FAD-dependent oxidoreductase [Hydrogenovibrio thermophilus]QAB15827.1 flavocytochrome c sulfide dehydrogenase flavin-binding protein [Hydrogenovibrio thermophilus]